MKERLLHGWTGVRWLRLVFAVVFLAAGIKGREPIAFMAALFFGAQAVFNIGCCGMGQCTPQRGSARANTEAGEITYERLD